MRMAELSAQSGVPRETIHFYLREGLLPRPVKGGRTVAFYGPEHLERLLLIRRLREEKYLPIAVIRRLLASPAAAAERDLDALAEVLHLAPDPLADAAPPRASPASVEAARARGLLGPRRGEDPADPAERRVLAVVEEVLALDPAARELTLDDLAACAEGLTSLVRREAELFFDAVIRSADLGGSIAALRSGRAPVARFIAAYRDLMLRRVVDDLLLAIERGRDPVGRAGLAPLPPEIEAELGIPARRAALRRAAEAGEEGAAERLAWHLFGCGAAGELARLPEEVRAPAGPRAAVLIAWGAWASERSAARVAALSAAAAAAPGFALARILEGEAILGDLLGQIGRGSGGASLMEAAVPALHAVACADPAGDPEPEARLLGLFHKGRVEVGLPAVLGRAARGAEALAQALAMARDPAQAAALDPACAAWVREGAALLLSRRRSP